MYGDYTTVGNPPWYQHRLADGVVVDEAQRGNYYIAGYGQDGDPPPEPPPEPPPPEPPPAPAPPPPSFESGQMKAVGPVAFLWSAASTASMAAGAYHGYRRNQSIGWALAWGFAGAIFPIITPGIALAQGFGKRKPGR